MPVIHMARKVEAIVVRATPETKELFRKLMHLYMSENPGSTAEDFIKYLLTAYGDESTRQCIKQCIESRRRVLIK